MNYVDIGRRAPRLRGRSTYLKRLQNAQSPVDGFDTTKVPLEIIATYDEKIDRLKINLSKTFTNRFVEEAARRRK